jgi:hypothetical protein
LTEAKASKELRARVLQGRLYAINGGKRQWNPSY